MAEKLLEKILIPEGVSCTLSNGSFVCTKGSLSSSHKVLVQGLSVSIEGNEIVLTSNRNTKTNLKNIKSHLAHIRNMIQGANKEFSYTLEACNVHFPMTLKIDKNILVVNNFLGEKTPRTAKILPSVKAEIKGQKIILTSPNKESAGQTAANIEKATRIRFRDRRIFQDGIYIVERPGRTI